MLISRYSPRGTQKEVYVTLDIIIACIGQSHWSKVTTMTRYQYTKTYIRTVCVGWGIVLCVRWQLVIVMNNNIIITTFSIKYVKSF